MKIILNDSLLINTGTNRACYLHPRDDLMCIKITISNTNKETKREVRYYNYLHKKGVSYDMLAEYYGKVKTNLGVGECVELIKDYDGSISQELDKYLDKELSDNEKIYIRNLLVELEKYLLKEKIYVKDLNSVNVAFQKLDSKGNSRLVIIDGLAHSWYIFILSRFVNTFLIGKIKQSWKQFLKSVDSKLK